MRLPLHMTLAASVALIFAAPAALLAQATFTPIGDLPGGEFESFAGNLSPDGRYITGSATSAEGTQAIRWTRQGGIVPLGDLPGGDFQSIGRGISAGGIVIVGQGSTSAGLEAMRWSFDTGLVALGDLPGGRTEGLCYGVSEDGEVIAGIGFDDQGQRATRWTRDTGIVNLGLLPGPTGADAYSDGFSISRDGTTIVGVSTSASGPQAYRWTAATGMVGLGDLPGGIFQSASSCTNRDGTIVGGRGVSALGPEAFIWRQSTGMVGMGDIPGGPAFGSEFFGISDDGSVAVGYGDLVSLTESTAAIWTPATGMVALKDYLISRHGLGPQLAGWNLIVCGFVSGDGRVLTGYGTNPDGNIEGFVVTLPPPCKADFNEDGALDIRDFTAFQNQFALGCP